MTTCLNTFLVFYRHTWQVQDKIDANNVAYTTGKLSFHTDYPALHHPPGVRWASTYFPQGRPRTNILLHFEPRRLYVSLANLSYVDLSPNAIQTQKISVLKSWIASYSQGIEDFHVLFWFFFTFLHFSLEITIGICCFAKTFYHSGISWGLFAHLPFPRELKEKIKPGNTM